jgi:hypothetical protein
MNEKELDPHERGDAEPQYDPRDLAIIWLRAAKERLNEYGSSRSLSLAKTKIDEAILWIEEDSNDILDD